MEYDEQILTLKQVDKLIKNIPKLQVRLYDHTMIELLFKLMYHGMLHVSEVLQIKPKDIDYSRNEITVLSKGDKNRTAVFTYLKLWNEIRVYLKDIPNDKHVFPPTRKQVWNWISQLGEISEIKIVHLTKQTQNVDNDMLINSRKHHLQNTGIFKESEIEQLARGYGNYQPESLKKKEEKANQILLVFCETCYYRNPSDAVFCCQCGHSLLEGKDIIR